MRVISKYSLYLRISILTLVPALLTGMSSCSDSADTGNGDILFTANLTGQQEVPSNSSSAKGDATLTYNEFSKTFNLVVHHNVTNPNAAHIHRGEPGVAGPPVFPLNPASPINYTSAPLDSMQKADLFAGNYYVNVHTPEFPAGLIRGQLERK